MSRYLSLDSYHGTQKSSFQLSAVSSQLFSRPSGSSSALIVLLVNLNLEGPARHYSCAGNSGRFSGAKLLKAGFRFSAFGFRKSQHPEAGSREPEA